MGPLNYQKHFQPSRPSHLGAQAFWNLGLVLNKGQIVKAKKAENFFGSLGAPHRQMWLTSSFNRTIISKIEPPYYTLYGVYGLSPRYPNVMIDYDARLNGTDTSYTRCAKNKYFLDNPSFLKSNSFCLIFASWKQFL